MKGFELTLRFPSGLVLIGGVSPPPHGVHATHAQDSQGQPILPSTAVRGALRETLEALLRGLGQPACSGGDGIDPDSDDISPRPCSLDNGQRCKACLLFGTRRSLVDQTERAPSALVLEDAVIASGEQPQDISWTTRPSVSISRSQRSAQNKNLFFHRLPATPQLKFVARGRLRTEGLEQELLAAVRATTHLGSGRSRGLAHVQIELNWLEDSPTPAPIDVPETGDIHVTVKLLSPTLIGAPVVDGNFRETRVEIPGSVLRGAVGFALAEMLDNPQQQAFQDLVAETGAHFGFLYPCHPHASELTAPLPITAVTCKHHGVEHGLADTLLDRIAIAHIESPEQALSVHKTSLSQCERCSSRLRGLQGPRSLIKPLTRTITRLSMDRTRSSARHQQLFSQVLLQPGTLFSGTIKNIPSSSKTHLLNALSSNLLSLGRGRSSGWGRVDVRIEPTKGLPPVEARAVAFHNALVERLGVAKLPLDQAEKLVPITFLSPLILPPEGDLQMDGEQWLMSYFSAERCLLKARKFCREGGWDQRQKGMETYLAVAAGAVFVLELNGRTFHDVLPLVRRLEQEGIGQRRHQGYGQVIGFDPFFVKRTLEK